MWAAGVAGGGAAVAGWRVVGPGFLWLAGGVAAGLAGAAALFGAGPPAVLAGGAALGGVVLARRPGWAAGLLGAAALAGLGAGAGLGAWLPVLTGSLLLGGVTSEMMLGHWYLVDPRLPRWALRRLDGAAGAGLVAEVAVLVALGPVEVEAAQAMVLGWAFLALATLTALLLVAVWFSLRQPAYSGVMAATGLSYLAVMTALGAVVTGRLAAGAMGPLPGGL